MTNEQIEQKKKQLLQLTEEMKAITKELVEAGAIELSEDDLDKVAGGISAIAEDLPQVDRLEPFLDNSETTTPIEITPPSGEPGNNGFFL